MQSPLPANAAAILNRQFAREFGVLDLHQHKVSDGLTITHQRSVYSVAAVPYLKAGDYVGVENHPDGLSTVFVYWKNDGSAFRTECARIGVDSFGFPLNSVPLASASSTAAPRVGYAAPVYLRDVDYGQHFIFDSQLQTLYVRARFGFGNYKDGQIAVVAIAATTEDGQTQVGLISEYMPLQTVRLVELVAPLQVRAL